MSAKWFLGIKIKDEISIYMHRSNKNTFGPNNCISCISLYLVMQMMGNTAHSFE